jgi:hypothetical protein
LPDLKYHRQRSSLAVLQEQTIQYQDPPKDSPYDEKEWSLFEGLDKIKMESWLGKICGIFGNALSHVEPMRRDSRTCAAAGRTVLNTPYRRRPQPTDNPANLAWQLRNVTRNAPRTRFPVMIHLEEIRLRSQDGDEDIVDFG